jgi:DDE family transposase
MQRFQIEISKDESYTSHSGVALVGLAVNRFTKLVPALAKAASLQAGGIPHADVVRSYLGVLSLGKNDYQAVVQHQADVYFKKSLGLARVPSEPTLRQRFDEHAEAFLAPVSWATVEFLKNAKVLFTPLKTGHVPLDIDVFTMDNSATCKEGVSRTYMGFDGYAPIAAYLANEGWLIHWQLRPGSQHSQKEYIPFLQTTLARVRQVYPGKLLVRKDSAHDALATRIELSRHDQVDYLISWNPRKADKEAWRKQVFAEGTVASPRPGKRVALMSVYEGHTYQDENGIEQKLTSRLVVKVTERETDKKGQRLLIPEIELQGWWTSLDLPETEVIALYRDHGTSEQFHSELKTDMDLERLPSGKFATNELIFACAALVYNILRFIGQLGLIGNRVPVRHPAKRRRIRTVIQELMYFAGRLIATGRQFKLRFSRHVEIHAEAFIRVYERLAYG